MMYEIYEIFHDKRILLGSHINLDNYLPNWFYANKGKIYIVDKL